MNKLLVTTLAAAVLAAGLRVPAAAQSVLQRCDRPLADAEQMAKSISDCSSALSSSRAALSTAASVSPSPDERIETSSTPLGVDLTRVAMTEPFHSRLVAHYVYAAYGAGDPGQCAALAPIGRAQENLCRQGVADLGFVRARYAGTAELVKACRRTDSEDGREGPASPCCSQLAESLGRGDACAKLVPGCFDGPSCRAFVGSAAGSAKDCAALPPPPPEDCKGGDCARQRAELVASCEGDAAFARAFKAKSIGECGASERCRALMGAGKAVAQEIAAKDMKNPAGAWFLKSAWKIPSVAVRGRGPAKSVPPPPGTAVKTLDFRGFVCSEPVASNANRQAATAVMNAALACLKDVDAASAQPSRELAAAIDERQEKLIRVNLRLDKLFESAKAAFPPPPKGQ